MSDYQIAKYTSGDYRKWNEFVASAKNATFLLNRDFLDYHSDRFEDHSIVVTSKGKWVAALPANRIGSGLHSHLGLTYGGLILGQRAKLSDVISIFREVMHFLSDDGIETFHLKSVPDIYNSKPSDELNYIMFLINATLTRRDSLSVIDLETDLAVSKTRMQGVEKGGKSGLAIKEVKAFDRFWNDILIPNLQQKFGVAPVHNIEEITKLHAAFPGNIRQFDVYLEDKIIAGTTIFETNRVAHVQYIGSDVKMRAHRAIDFLFHHLISEVFRNKKYFDFGISNENNGRNINEGLLFWKESFGASTKTQDFYTVNTKNYHLLNNVLI